LSLIDPEEHFELEGLSDQAWRERIGNAVPSAAAEAIAGVIGSTLLLAWSGETSSHAVVSADLGARRGSGARRARCPMTLRFSFEDMVVGRDDLHGSNYQALSIGVLAAHSDFSDEVFSQAQLLARNVCCALEAQPDMRAQGIFCTFHAALQFFRPRV
jgi:hypothetical protein